MNSMSLFNGCFAQLCKIPIDVFYCTLCYLDLELSKFREPVIRGKSDQILPLWNGRLYEKVYPFGFKPN